jgi:hypothetical protein
MIRQAASNWVLSTVTTQTQRWLQRVNDLTETVHTVDGQHVLH